MFKNIFNIARVLPSQLSYKHYVFNKNTSFAFSTAQATAAKDNNASQLEKLSYYELLEVRSNASPREIKSNFLRLAKIYHPDVYKGSDVDRFKYIKLAYQVLKKPQTRRQYDQEQEEQEGKTGTKGNSFDGSNSRQNDREEDNFTSDGKKEKKRSFTFDGMKIDDTIDLNKEYEKFFSKPIERKPEEVVAYEDVVDRQMSMEERVRHEFSFIKNNENEINFRFGHQLQYQEILKDNIDIMNSKAAATDAVVDYTMKKKERKLKKNEKILLAVLILIGVPFVQQALERRQQIYKKIDKGSQLFLRIQEDQELEEFHDRIQYNFKEPILDNEAQNQDKNKQQTSSL